MTDFTLKNIKAQLKVDPQGSYKKWLMEKLQEYKTELDSSRQQILAPEEYDRTAHLARALETALSVISGYSTDEISGVPEKSQTSSLDNIFNH